MSYQLFFRNYNYRISTTLSRTSHGFQSRGTSMNLWYSPNKNYYISPLVYCNAWRTLFRTEEKLVDPLSYYDQVEEPVRVEEPVTVEDDSGDVQSDSFISETMVKKRPKKKKRASKTFSRRRT